MGRGESGGGDGARHERVREGGESGIGEKEERVGDVREGREWEGGESHRAERERVDWHRGERVGEGWERELVGERQESGMGEGRE